MRCYIYLAQNGYYYRHCDPDPQKILIALLCVLAAIVFIAFLVWLFADEFEENPPQPDASSLIAEAKKRWLDAKNKYEDMEAELEDTIQQIKREWLHKER